MIVLIAYKRAGVILRLSDEDSRRTSTYTLPTLQVWSANLFFDFDCKLQALSFLCP
jgi:hypothetical protein